MMAENVLLFGATRTPEVIRQEIVDDLKRLLDDREHLSTFPAMLSIALEQRVWESARISPNGAQIAPSSLHDFIHKPYPFGIGANYEIVENLIRGHADVLAQWCEVTRRKAGAPEGNKNAARDAEEEAKTNLDNVQDCLKAPTGNSAAAGMRKLLKAAAEGNEDAARELEAVKAGDKKVHRACVDAGLRKTTKIDADVRQRCDRANAERAAEHLPHEVLEAFVSDLFAAGHKSLAIEIKNLIGESIMDRRYGERS